MMLEIVLACVHPNMITRKLEASFDANIYNRNATYEVNDLLMIPCLIRFYSIIRLIVVRTNFYGSKVSRVCKMMGIKLSYFFAIKCLIKKEPLKMWLSLLTVSVMILSSMLKVLENYSEQYQTFGNCIWNVLITMTTVGYGDISAKTNLGRIVAIVTAIIGTLFISMVSVTLSDLIDLDQKEVKCFDLYGRMENKKKLKNFSSKIFVLSFNLLSLKNKLRELDRNQKDKENNKELIAELNKKLKEVVYKRWVIKKDFRMFLQ